MLTAEELIKLVDYLDKKYGLMIGDLNREELEEVNKIISQLILTNDRSLRKVNIHALKKLGEK